MHFHDTNSNLNTYLVHIFSYTFLQFFSSFFFGVLCSALQFTIFPSLYLQTLTFLSFSNESSAPVFLCWSSPSLNSCLVPHLEIPKQVKYHLKTAEKKLLLSKLLYGPGIFKKQRSVETLKKKYFHKKLEKNSADCFSLHSETLRIIIPY